MTTDNDLTEAQRQQIFKRDRYRCLNCGNPEVTLQHRRAKAMGGRGTYSATLTPADGVALCGRCNAEAEGSGQREALRYGWKVKRASTMRCSEIPYYDRLTATWWMPDDFGARARVDTGWAMTRVRLAQVT